MIAERPFEPDDLRRLALESAPELADLPIVALGWATVDLDAVARALAPEPGHEAFSPASRDEHLGARAAVHRPDPSSAEPIQVLLEPDTEGRLAGSLARRGEGFAAIWFEARDGLPDGLAARFGAAAGGPLGPARLLAGGGDGPFVLVLEESA